MNLFEQYFPQQAKYLQQGNLPYGANPQANANGSATGSSSASWQITPSNLPPPEQPSFQELTEQYNLVPQRFNTRQASSSIDDAITATRITGSQAAQNAQRGYSQRLTQQGINPVAADVVGAQVKTASNRAAGEMAVQRDAMKLAAQKDAAMVAAGIAEKIADMRTNYSQTLAEYNARQSTMNMQAQQQTAGNYFTDRELDLREQQMQAAQLANGGAQKKKTTEATNPYWDFYPGYIPNTGPIIGARINGAVDNNRVFTSYPNGY